MTEPKFVIYALSLDGLEYRYVGLTTVGALARFYGHLFDARAGKKNLPLYRWMRKHGSHNVRVTILEECPRSALAEREMHWIRKLRYELGYSLLNCSDGGEGSGKGKTEETLKNYSAGAKRRYSREEERIAQSERSKRQGANPATRAKLSAAAKQGWTPERRERQARRLRDEWQDPSVRRAQSAPKKSSSRSDSMKERWKDPAYRAEQTAGLAKSNADPALKAKRSAAAKARWERERLHRPNST